jgi:Uma2 family endonuclease
MVPDQRQHVTAEELFRMPDDGYWYELVQGRLIKMSPPGALHGVVGIRVQTALDQFVAQQQLGLVLPQDTGFKLASNPDTVRAPDAAFVRRDRIPSTGVPVGYWPGAPDLAVEVRSASDRRSDLRRKASEYLRHGARLVWVIDPTRRDVTVFRPGSAPRTLRSDDELDGEDVVPGFRLGVRRLFE